MDEKLKKDIERIVTEEIVKQKKIMQEKFPILSDFMVDRFLEDAKIVDGITKAVMEEVMKTKGKIES